MDFNTEYDPLVVIGHVWCKEWKNLVHVHRYYYSETSVGI